MTVHVLSLTSGASPGAGAVSEVKALANQPLKCAVFDYDMGTDNYTTGGNDISALWTSYGFRDIFYIGIEQKDTNTAADRRELTVDYSARTLLLYTAFGTEGTASDQGVVALRLFVVGI